MEIALDGEDTALHEPEHIEEVFTALAETMAGVTGNEAFGLTKAQTYMWAVLSSSGVVPRSEAVRGAEGFFETLGSGAKKIWEYIQKIFKSIWNFFFGKSEDTGPSIVKDAEAKIAANQEALKAWAQNDAKLKEHMNKQWAQFDRVLDDIKNHGTPAEKTEAASVKEELVKAKSLPAPEQAKVYREVVEKVVKINSRTQRALDDVCKQAVEDYKGYLTGLNNSHDDKLAGTPFLKMWNDWRTAQIEGAKKSIEVYTKIPQGMRTLGDAERAQEQLAQAIKYIDGEMFSISSGIKSDVISQIKKLEEKVNHPDTKNVDHFNKSLTACGRLLKLCTQIIFQLKRTAETVKRLSNMINRLFGIVA